MFRKTIKSLGVISSSALVAGTVLFGVSQTAAAEENYEWPRFFNVITPIVGTANHSLAVAWTSEFSAQTQSRSRVLPGPNGFSRSSWLETGEGRIAMLQASDYFDQMDGVEGFAAKNAGPADTRVMNVNMVTPWGYMVRGDSDIETIHDIGPGTRIAYAASSSFLLVGVDALLAYLDLDHDEVTLVEVGNYGANTAIVAEGRADVAFTSPLSGPSYEAEAGPNGIRWLELPEASADPEAYARYRALHTGYVPAETEAGVTSAKGIRMDHAYQTNHVRADEDEEFVYQLYKWMDVNHDSYKDDFTHAHMMTVDNMVNFLNEGHLQPLHQGAIRYLKEKGVWTDAFQERQDALVDLAVEREQLFHDAIAAAESEGIRVAAGDEEWVQFWADYRAERGHDKPYGTMVSEIK